MSEKVYRKRIGKDCWHFMENCSNWPVKNYDERVSKPTSGEFCNQCLAKKRNAKPNEKSLKFRQS